MTRKAFWLIAAAYAALAIGMVVSLWLFGRQADDTQQVNKRLVGAAVAYCQAGLQPDAEENVVLKEIADGTYKGGLDPICLKIGDRLDPNHNIEDLAP